MKKQIAIALILLAVTVSIAYGYARSSGEQTADGVVSNKSCRISSVMVITNGTDDAKVIIYDNGSAASGTVVAEMTVTGSGNFGGRYWNPPLRMQNGIYVDVSGTGASYIVDFF